MGGTIDLESEFGKGTKAFFKIPFRMPSPEALKSTADENNISDSVSDRLQYDASVNWRGSEASEHSPQTDILNPNFIEHNSQSPSVKPESRSRTSSIHSQPGDVRVNRISIDNSDSAFSPVTPNQVLSKGSNSVDMKSLLPTDTRPQYHVLVVEDNHINQQIAMKIVKKLGFTVSAVWNGKVRKPELRLINPLLRCCIVATRERLTSYIGSIGLSFGSQHQSSCIERTCTYISSRLLSCYTTAFAQ